MAKTYHFKEGYIQISNLHNKKYHIYNIFCFVFLLSIFLIVFLFTDYVFSSTLSTESYYEIISLGAVFATIGSSIISITSLACNYFFEEYKKARETLLSFNNELRETDNWNFIEDNKAILKSVKNTITYQTFFPEVVFEFGGNNHLAPSSEEVLYIWETAEKICRQYQVPLGPSCHYCD